MNIDRSKLITSAVKLQAAKDAQRAQVSADRRIQEETFFMFEGHKIDCDAQAQKTINGIKLYVLGNNEFPPGFEGYWKTYDNLFFAIDVPTFNRMFDTMLAQGTINFNREQAIKKLIDDAETIEEVRGFSWQTRLPDEQAADPEVAPE